MIRQFDKGKSVKLSKHFQSIEFDCKCSYDSCTITYVDDDLISCLEILRIFFKNPLTINSGFRCVKHNADVGGKIGSIHMTGKAADIKIENVALDKVYEFSEKIFDGLGKYKTFIHVDKRGYRARWVG